MPRQVQIGSDVQRPDDKIAYAVPIDDSYPSPSTPVSTLYDVTSGTPVDVTSTKLSGSPTIGPATINDIAYDQAFLSPKVIDLVPASTYRLEFKFESGGNTFEPYLVIVGVA